ncbi:hypothetical protein JXR93_10720 [bacterium]|nr:hypothetical protein [bacterium]
MLLMTISKILLNNREKTLKSSKTLKILTIFLMFFASESIFAVNLDLEYRKIQKLFYEWHPEEAKEILEKIETQAEGDISFLYLKARYLYLIGDYKSSGEILRYIEMNFPKNQYSQLEDRIEVMKNAEEKTKTFKVFQSDDKKFSVFTPEGKNEILGPIALDTLQKAFNRHTQDLDYKYNKPVRVEILPDIETLDAISGLTLKEIQTSGTIALCDDNKLMIVSPSSLVKGYGWLDTISHELVHFVISKKTRNRTPIWIHEGIAKFQESRWSDGKKYKIEKFSEHILATAHEKKHYISFEAMSPSLAKLPSQEDASLAYAQVATLMEWVYEKNGYSGIVKILENLEKYNSDKKAIKESLKLTLPQLLKEWKNHITQKKYKTYPGLMYKPILFKTVENEQEYKLSEVSLFKNRDMQKYIRLGNMMFDLKRFKASEIEYTKALKFRKNEYPYLENRIASLYLKNKEYKKIVALLKPTLNLFDDYIDTYMNLGEAYFNLNELALAEKMFLKSIEFNPFLPEIYTRLADIYEKTGKKEALEIQKERLKYLK